jgi:ABC-type thiamine transport system substrate-binding protein
VVTAVAIASLQGTVRQVVAAAHTEEHHQQELASVAKDLLVVLRTRRVVPLVAVVVPLVQVVPDREIPEVLRVAAHQTASQARPRTTQLVEPDRAQAPRVQRAQRVVLQWLMMVARIPVRVAVAVAVALVPGHALAGVDLVW